MPVLLNMFFVKDAAGRKPSYGERTILNAVEEANSVLLKDKTRGFSFPPAGKPVALNYGVSFGDPINCGAEFGDEIGRKLIDNLYADTLGFAKFRRDRGPPAVNVFFVWKLKVRRPPAARRCHDGLSDRARLQLVRKARARTRARIGTRAAWHVAIAAQQRIRRFHEQERHGVEGRGPGQPTIQNEGDVHKARGRRTRLEMGEEAPDGSAHADALGDAALISSSIERAAP